MTVSAKHKNAVILYSDRSRPPGKPGGRKENAMTAEYRSNGIGIYLTGRLAGERFPPWWLYRWRELLEKRKKENRRTLIRYAVERVYSGKDSMENVLTTVSEEAARKNVEEKLKSNSKK